MNVYVALCDYGREGERILAICTTRRLANKAISGVHQCAAEDHNIERYKLVEPRIRWRGVSPFPKGLEVGDTVTGRAIPPGTQIVAIVPYCATLSNGSSRLLADLKRVKK